jgi:succinyldiaminopimelate transaminase
MADAEPFVPPPYPYEQLLDLAALAGSHEGGCVDLSVGTPTDTPPREVIAALGASGAENGYPPSIGTAALREAAVAWMARRLSVTVDPDAVAACVGTKEFVAGLPHWLRLRTPSRDTVLHPAIAYPTYEMGAMLAGCRAVAYEDLADISAADAARALCLWVNSPANPTGELLDLRAAGAWGRARGVPVFSDECYVEFTWDESRRQTVLNDGSDGVVAVHSLSKRSNLAGTRVGFYAGDADLVRYLAEVRKHAGFMVPGPTQAAAVVALADDVHVDEQRARYWRRLERLQQILATVGAPSPLPAGGFYLWVPAPDGDAWSLTKRLAADGGALVSPGEFYGPGGAGHVRVAAVQPDDRIELVAARLGVP